ncbi:MAG: diguanylate cyclase [Methylophilus sp.]
MIHTYKFLAAILDTIDNHITVINHEGTIQYVNHGWATFGQNNDSVIKDWNNVNYLEVCDQAAKMGDEYSPMAAEGIRKVINAEQDSFYFEYPCHTPDEKHWFMMRVTPFVLNETTYYLISHTSITERKLAEEKVLNLSRIDGLTNIPNRRYFDEFIKSEWLRCKRLKLPISLAILDVDYFKQLNDQYGHQVGDDCLISIAGIIAKLTKRPSDLCARHGGEEFAIVLGNTTLEASLLLLNQVNDAILKLKIPNIKSPIQPTVTVSIGLATMYPHLQDKNEKELIRQVDILLYEAKGNGRNQIVYLNI